MYYVLIRLAILCDLLLIIFVKCIIYILFIYGDMLSVDGDADAAVEARIRIGWNKFRQLVPLLTNKDVSLIMRGRLYKAACCTEVRPGL